jgi:hypothetical protein
VPALRFGSTIYFLVVHLSVLQSAEVSSVVMPHSIDLHEKLVVGLVSKKILAK